MKSLFLSLAAIMCLALAGAVSDGETVDAGKGRKLFMQSLSNKGLSAETVLAKADKPVTPHRPTPIAELRDSFTAEHRGKLPYEEVNIELLEESGVSRICVVQFGLPLPEGAIFATNRLRLLDGASEIPMQSTVAARWNDGSLKWVQLRFSVVMKSGEKKSIKLELGERVSRTASEGGVKILRNGDIWTIDTGRLSTQINVKHFKLLENLKADGKALGGFGAGMILVDEQGGNRTSEAGVVKRVTIEENGALFTTVRVDGTYSGDSGLSYTARLRFQAGSPKVGIEFTHINTAVKHEFTDVTALYLDYRAADTPLENGERSFQMNDRRAQMADGKIIEKRLDGIGSAGNVVFGVRDFWQRFPKAHTVFPNGVRIELLPFLEPGFGDDLPWYHRFPFRAGKHRSKWGMSFTERIDFDFGGGKPEILKAELQSPVVAVLPSTYLAKSGVIPGIGGANASVFAVWDTIYQNTWNDTLERREKQREYGYFNYGDAWGERGKVNWNNNEYDWPASLFAAFYRTGNRDYYRWALVAARHQADVDICHAYPDPYYVGANLQHSIGHTGLWMAPKQLDCSYLYDTHADAGGGHVWARGMGLAFLAGGDTRAFDAIQELGDHIRFAFAPNFKKLSLYIRDGGWSLKAACHIYETTGDAEHRQAADMIADLIIKEQSFDRGGAWDRRVGRIYAKYKEKEHTGNTVFQVGLVMEAMAQYHRLSQREEAKKSLLATAEWLIKGFQRDFYGWWYDMDYRSKPIGMMYGLHISVQLNCLSGTPVMYAANLSGDRRFQECSFNAMRGLLFLGLQTEAKEFANSTYDLDYWLEQMNVWTEQHGDKFTYTEAEVISDILKHRQSTFRVRLPSVRSFNARLTRTEAVLRLERIRYGGMPGEKVEKFVEIIGPNGNLVHRDTIESKQNYIREYKVKGAINDIFTIKISDDQEAVWTLIPDPDYLASALFGQAGIGIGSPQLLSRYHFIVPRKTRTFKIWQAGFMSGSSHLRVYYPDGKLAGGTPAADSHDDGKENAKFFIECANPFSDRDTVWSLDSWGRGTQTFGFQGIPCEIYIDKPDIGNITLKTFEQ